MNQDQDGLSFTDWLKQAKGNIPEPMWVMFQEMGEDFWRESRQKSNGGSSVLERLSAAASVVMDKQPLIRTFVGGGLKEVGHSLQDMGESMTHRPDEVINAEYKTIKEKKKEPDPNSINIE